MGLNAILVSLPNFRVHLDGGMMVLDRDLIVAHVPSIDYYPSLILYNEGEVEVQSLYKYVLDNGYTVINSKSFRYELLDCQSISAT
jgi:hypothetical protein